MDHPRLNAKLQRCRRIVNMCKHAILRRSFTYISCFTYIKSSAGRAERLKNSGPSRHKIDETICVEVARFVRFENCAFQGLPLRSIARGSVCCLRPRKLAGRAQDRADEPGAPGPAGDGAVRSWLHTSQQGCTAGFFLVPGFA